MDELVCCDDHPGWLSFLFGNYEFSLYGVILGASILSFFGILIIRYRGQLISGLFGTWALTHRLNASVIRERVLIVGSGRTAENIAGFNGASNVFRKIPDRRFYR